SGREMLQVILAGVGAATTLAELARGRLRAKLPLLRQAPGGRVQGQHRILIRHALAHSDFLEPQVGQLSAAIAATAGRFNEAVALLETIPCVGHTAATAISAAIGVDMQRFPSARHLASWAGVCPGNRQRAGKRLGAKTTHGTSACPRWVNENVVRWST